MTISFTRRFKVKDEYSKITANIVKAKIKVFMKQRRLNRQHKKSLKRRLVYKNRMLLDFKPQVTAGVISSVMNS